MERPFRIGPFQQVAVDEMLARGGNGGLCGGFMPNPTYEEVCSGRLELLGEPHLFQDFVAR